MKRKRKALCALVSLLVLFHLCCAGILNIKANAKMPPVTVSAKAAYLYEANTGASLYEKNINLRMGPASTTKIVTAILTIENTSVDETVVITEQMTGIEGSSLYLKEGESLSVSDLLYGLMLRSANDAAVALAIHTSGSVDRFVDEMNAFADRLGLVNTHFDNPNGLDGKTHYTTARELAIITEYALKNPTFRKIVSTKKTIIAKGHDNARLLVNHNKLLGAYEGCIGVKTGFTKKCGRTLVSAYCEGGIYLICVTLNAPDDWSDHKKLFDYARDSYQMTNALKPYAYTRRVGVLGGVGDTVEVYNDIGSHHLEARGQDAPILTVTLPRMLVAPISKGEIVGNIRIEYADGTVEDIPLLARDGVTKRKRTLFQ